MILYGKQHKIIFDALKEYKKQHEYKGKSVETIEKSLKELFKSELYIFKKEIGHAVRNTNIGGNICPICRCREATTKHHIVPSRMMMPDNPLKELKIKICKECHQAIHPENVYIALFRKLIPIVENICGKSIKHRSTWHKIKGIAQGQWTKNHLDELKEINIE